MSTFSSVVNKSGKKFAPKATARRNPSSRGSSITPGSSDPPYATVEGIPSVQDAVNSPNVSQVRGPEQDVVFSAPPALAEQSASTTKPLDTISPGTGLALGTSRIAENLKLTGQARKDAVRERRVVNQDSNKERVPRRQSKAYPTFTNKDEMSHQQPSLSEATHEDATGAQGHVPSLEPVARSTKSQKGGNKRKRTVDNPGIASGYIAAIDATVENPSTDGSAPRKRQKTVPRRLRSKSTTSVPTSMAATSDEGHTRAPAITSAAATECGDTASAVPRAKRKSRTKKTMQEVAAEIVAEAAGDCSEDNEEITDGTKNRKRKRKRKRPEGAEDYEIAPSEVKMADLVKDTGFGKGSKLEARLEEVDWDEVKKKRKEAAEEAEKRREREREEKIGISVRQDDVPTAPTVPRLTIRDNQIVMEEESRIVDRHAEIDQGADDTVNVQDINDVTRRVNQSTIGRQSGVKQKGHWNNEMTDLFYKGLRMFGTDFMMISKMFPGMSRRHIKLKYTREERTNLPRVNKNLIAKEDVDMEEYSQMSNQVYEDPEIVKGVMRAEEQRLRDEDVARRARETEAEQGEIGAEDNNVLQSREQDTVEPADGDEPETPAPETESSAKENRFSSVARSIVHRAMVPKKTKKQNALARKRERKKKTGLEGTEEVVGSIDDIQRD
jgi:transcription factor TFIIIB component B''